ncbi:MAG: HdeD family acid-resistance protein [Nitrospira sp.]
MNSTSILNSDEPIRDDGDAVRQNWRWVLASGIAFVCLGSLAFGYSVLVTLASVFVLGWLLFFGGIFQAVHAFKVSQWSGFVLELLLAILYVAVGLVMITDPGAGALSLTLVIAGFFLIGGVVRILAGMILHPPSRAWLLLSGGVTICLGILIWAEWPVSGLWVIGVFVAIDMIFSGTWLIRLALKARRLPTVDTRTHLAGPPSTTFEVQPSQP